ncbi:hypothetical protein [Nitratireductor sp. XY-223]|uniref:hypothetical protein n=1 Tax=Nitratireductor sp. XY-223 TaxID=2561926 RepID=UPI0010AA1E10|nr:hypothetical protein [Nitratireductor sp. XY-223]
MRLMTVAAAVLAAGGVTFVGLASTETRAVEEGIAQTRTDGWTTTRYSRFGDWESICEIRQSSSNGNASKVEGGVDERCYLRLVDRFGPPQDSGAHDRFGAISAMIQPHENGLRITFQMEKGLKFEKGGFYLARENFPVWRLDIHTCLESGVCSFSGPAARALVRSFSDQSAHALHMYVKFTDRYDQTLVRKWPMLPFAGAFADFEQNVRLTGM